MKVPVIRVQVKDGYRERKESLIGRGGGKKQKGIEEIEISSRPGEGDNASARRRERSSGFIFCGGRSTAP